MPAIVLVREGAISKAFEMREVPVPVPSGREVLIDVEASGINYADGMAIKGQYRDAPPLPSILGYDVCGRIVAIGPGVKQHTIGERVTAMTRFGGYARYAVTDERAVATIAGDTDLSTALSLATQGSTAWYCAEEACKIYEGERVIITAAAGGVGSMLLQLAKRRKARIFGIVSTQTKADLIMEMGAEAVLNRSKGDIFKQYQALQGRKAIDVMFDSAGGSYLRKCIRDLAPGGRFVGFGGSQRGDSKSFFSLLSFALSFGFYHPAPFLLESHSLIGVSMLRLADHKPYVVQRCLEQSVQLFNEGGWKPLEGAVFPIGQIVEAHEALMKGSIPGKIVMKW
jgi:NADPH:quinone reductase-like Zn-dependent oxidoreductase